MYYSEKGYFSLLPVKAGPRFRALNLNNFVLHLINLTYYLVTSTLCDLKTLTCSYDSTWIQKMRDFIGCTNKKVPSYKKERVTGS